jgi:hypothetical protein
MTITSIINEVTKLLTSFTFWFPLTFILIALISIIMSAGNPEKRKEFGARISWIIIGLFVLLSIGGIVAILNNTFFSSNATITTPPGNSSGGAPAITPTPKPSIPGTGTGPSTCTTVNGKLVCN